MGIVLVPTPLGNLRDITLRALDVLRECDLVAAEDTRVARRLLSAHAIVGKTVVRYDGYCSPAAMASLLERASAGVVAVTSDAGMPGISDPGQSLVVAARAAGISVEVLPGGTAFVSAAVLSGFALTPLLFDGFFPRTVKAARSAVQTAMRSGATTVWYESPKRLAATLRVLASEAPEGDVFVARELTKKFEQHLCGTPAEVLATLPSPLKGEIVLVFRPAPPVVVRASAASLDEQIDALSNKGLAVAAIAKRLSGPEFGDRASVYARALERRKLRRT